MLQNFIIFMVLVLVFFIYYESWNFNHLMFQRIDGGPYYRPVALPPRPLSPPASPGIFASLTNSFNSIVSNIFG
ncbi:hypothetical protein B5X24_HaOG212646 [Helicoverpa armigera]|nr:hypothetical protein B5X24_HaOG212646 [Helicoverpa armigera]